MGKIINLFTICMLLLALSAAPASAKPAAPDPVAEAALLIDAQNGQVLFAKNAGKKMYPASTTKIMTALVALEKSSPGEMVKISKRAAEVGGTRVGLQPGEQVRMKDLLYIMLLNSANDAAVAIAEHVGGSVEGFAGLMNQRARQIGARDTHFVNPHGMPDENHYTTARDLALIAREAMQNAEFRRIVQTESYRVERKKNMDPDVLQRVEALERVYGPVQEDFFNQNRLLWHNYYGYKGANGVKTGYTSEAGQCLVASAKRQDRELIAVLLKSQGASLWTDATMLLDYGFNHFARVELVHPGEIITDAGVRFGKERAVLETGGYCYYNFPAGEEPRVERRVELKQNIPAPLEAGDKLGDLVLEAGGKELGRVPLVTVRPVPRKVTSYWWFQLGAVLAVLGTARLLAARRRRRPANRVVYINRRERGF